MLVQGQQGICTVQRTQSPSMFSLCCPLDVDFVYGWRPPCLPPSKKLKREDMLLSSSGIDLEVAHITFLASYQSEFSHTTIYSSKGSQEMQDAVYLANIPITIKEREHGFGETSNSFCYVHSYLPAMKLIYSLSRSHSSHSLLYLCDAKSILSLKP